MSDTEFPVDPEADEISPGGREIDAPELAESEGEIVAVEEACAPDELDAETEPDQGADESAEALLQGADDGHIRMVEALLFASAEPLSVEDLAAKLPEGADIEALLLELQTRFADRGVVLMEIAERWAFRTAPDLAFLMEEHAEEDKRLSRAALETLAIVAYHQPVTRAEIEEIRGVSVSKGTLDQLLEVGWVCMRGRRRTPGRPVTYGTTEAFLEQFSLSAISDLPGLEDLKAAGLLDNTIPPGFVVPDPAAAIAQAEEDSLDGDEETGDLGYRPEEPELAGEADAETGDPAEDELAEDEDALPRLAAGE